VLHSSDDHISKLQAGVLGKPAIRKSAAWGRYKTDTHGGFNFSCGHLNIEMMSLEFSPAIGITLLCNLRNEACAAV
jgi:hypothetical protein